MRWNILIHLLIILDLNTWFMSYFIKIFKYFHVFYNCLKIIFRVMSIWNSKWQSIRLSWKFDPLLWRFYQNNCLVITFNQRERKKEMNELFVIYYVNILYNWISKSHALKMVALPKRSYYLILLVFSTILNIHLIKGFIPQIFQIYG